MKIVINYENVGSFKKSKNLRGKKKKWKALRKRDKRVISIINSITDNE